ncbi:MAG TPA: carboxypeptidase-like regulatory domain-containing protein, partial [Saprospiraceae bacterium]|nr:carboxypeptidase-like regulatory domain-containing protein [Saprospiraceae bacterium]
MKATTTLLTLAFALSFLLITAAQAQSTLLINVKDNEKTPLIGATVQLLRLADSVTVSEVTDPDGTAKFERLSQGLHSVVIRYIGFQNLEKSVSIKAGQNRLDYALQPEALALGEVTVTAKRPLITQEEDKMIIDPEPIANTSTSTLEVLEKTPGIFVDQEGGIFLNSATPAVIYINGREQRMSARDIATILQSLPPGSVQKIEVLRTPSTKYDAASSGGIVNVVLKKGVRIGRTGSLNMGMNQGVYGNQFIGVNLNDSGGKGSYYINTNYSRNDAVEDLKSSRELSAESILSQNARSRFPSDFGYVGYGFNLDPNERWGFNYDGRVNLGLRRSSAYNLNTINTLDNILLSENDNSTDNRTGFFSLQQDLGLIHKLDTIGSEWDTKFSYNYNNNNNEQDYSIQSLRPLSGTLAGNGDNRQNRHFILLQSDLTYRFPKQGIK